MSFRPLTLDSTTLFLESLSLQSPRTPLPPSFSLLSSQSPLPSFPSDFPHSKLIPRTRFIVDGFQHAGDYSVSYFLSHFHSDHYNGLTPNWSKGVIFCSHTTARLLVEVLKVPATLVVPLSVSEPVLIDGCEVSFIDANHCPGAVQFLFKVPISNGKFEKYVHTGDFRYRDSMKLDPFISDFVGADAIFLDTTYCNPKFIFPSQEESVDYIAGVIERIGVENEGSSRSVLFLVATYVIGKENILLEISRRCNRKILVDSRKMSILRVLGFGEVGVFTEEESESDVHVVGWNVLGETWPYFRPNFVNMKEIMNERGYSKVVGFVPTGWTYEVKHNKFAVRMKDSFEIHLVPYSEHSNYLELREYVRLLRPKRVVPTVGVDVEKHGSKIANKMQKHFSGLVDEMAIKQEFFLGFHRGMQNVGEKADCGTMLNDVSGSTKEVSLPELKPINQTVPENVGISLDLNQENSKLLNENHSEELLQELQNYLPTWVTRNQILNLLCSSEGNVVEAVSNFYEHETRLYDEIRASTSSFMPRMISSCNSESAFIKCFGRSENVPLSQSYKLGSVVCSTTSSVSKGKRKKNHETKTVKKARKSLASNSSGPRQCSIKSFFSKVTSITTQSDGNGTVLMQCDIDKNMSTSSTIKLYEEEIDQFLQIVDGTDKLRNYAATLLEKTKGDINLAVDIFLCSPRDTSHENEGRSDECGKLLQTHCESKSDHKNKVGEQIRNKADASVPGKPTGDIAVNSISLPPEKYSPIEHACWRDGEPAPYIHLARTFELVENEKGKIKATSMLCNMFRSLLLLSPENVLPAVYLCTNKIAPDHENMELNIGGSIVIAALEEACGTNRSKIRELYNSYGDLGDVAQLCRQKQSLLAPPDTLSIRGVFAVLRKISVQTGSGSAARKKNLIMNLMCSCREKEMKFLVRTLVRNLRIGAMLRTVLPALAHAVVMNSIPSVGTSENLKEQLQRLSAAVVEVYDILPNLDLVVPALLDKGVQFSSTTLSMVPGIPIKPMLAKITNGIPQVLKLFQNKAFTCEYKYDGQRAQIHRLADGSVRVFSRNGDETTSRFPDLVNIIKELCSPSVTTFILDAEVVAVDRKNDRKLMSFQELSSRERGSKDSLITVDSIKVDICVFAFDIMFTNGEQLLGFPLRQRQKYLKNLFGDEKLGYFEYAREMRVEQGDASMTNEVTLAKMKSFLDDAIHSSCEGIMVKSLDVDAGYTPSKRTDSWLKVKQDYVDGLGDSLDLVPIGAWYGNGRKVGWYSPFLMACHNPDTQEFQSVCRVMSGFSDSLYMELKEFFAGEKVLTKKPPYYQTDEVPDKWFSAEIVWEIKGADFTVSPVHHAAIGLVHPSRGISVRFPRFVRSLLDTKPEECSTATDIAEMFHSQARKMDVMNVEE